MQIVYYVQGKRGNVIILSPSITTFIILEINQYTPLKGSYQRNKWKTSTYFFTIPSKIRCTRGLRIYPLAIEQRRFSSLQIDKEKIRGEKVNVNLVETKK